jgi:hypothetical protein
LEKKVKNKSENSTKPQPNGKVLRCINIDCVFNSSNEHGAIRNTCRHPNVVVESRFADITIAICSEFRSKKDYEFEKPSILIEKKTGEKTEIVGRPAVGTATVETVTTKELEQGVSHSKSETKPLKKSEEPLTSPVIIQASRENIGNLLPSEIYNLSDRPGTDFLVLKKLYQPYTKRGLAGSIIFHLFLIFVLYQTLVPKEEVINGENNQRIVIVEDLEMPKFDPPDLDKQKEDELKEKEIKDNTKDVKPKVNIKKITPKINRPVDTTPPPDTNKSSVSDTTKKFDSSLVNQRDTTRLMVPDSLRSSFDQNDVGLKMWFPKGWKLIDNRQINLTQKEFNGVIISTDSLSEDPGAVNVFVIIDDPQHSAYNKVTYKNPFPMDDSIVVAYVTDPVKSSGKKFSTKYYLFTDPTGLKNILVNVDFASQAMMDKYAKLVDAVVRSIKIAEAPKNPGTP